MPKTFDEIKKGLGFCSRATCGDKGIECPYECGNSTCMIHLTSDALALIRQLEAERDAAVAGLKYSCTCPECKYFSNDIQEPCRGCKPTDSKFEWRGVQKEDSDA